MATIAAFPPNVNPSALANQFSNIAVSISGKQGELRNIEGRSIYPARSWSDAMGNLATQFDDARTAYAQLRPADTGFIAQLGVDERRLSFTSGEMYQMYQTQTAFGRGWADSLTPSIRDAQQAVAMLAGAPAAR